MAHEDTIYVIVPFDEVTQQMIDDSCEDGFDTLRHSLAGVDRVVLKWIGDTPASLVGYTQYSHAEILTEMEGTDWSEDLGDLDVE